MTETQTDLAHYQTDHDLLVVLNERVSALTEAVKSKTGDHEVRIRALETQRWIMAGVVMTISTLGGYILSIFF